VHLLAMRPCRRLALGLTGQDHPSAYGAVAISMSVTRAGPSQADDKAAATPERRPPLPAPPRWQSSTQSTPCRTDLRAIRGRPIRKGGIFRPKHWGTL
jgi:hypothetical protein